MRLMLRRRKSPPNLKTAVWANARAPCQLKKPFKGLRRGPGSCWEELVQKIVFPDKFGKTMFLHIWTYIRLLATPGNEHWWTHVSVNSTTNERSDYNEIVFMLVEVSNACGGVRNFGQHVVGCRVVNVDPSVGLLR